MKKLFAAALLALSSLAFGATLTPIQFISAAGSTSGQVITSTGPTTPLAWSNVSATALAAQAANTVVANVTGSSAPPTAVAIPSCNTSTSALQYTSGTGFSCFTGSAPSASPVFTGTAALPITNTVSGAAGTSRQFIFQTGGAARWVVQTSGEAESGSNAGSNFYIQNYSDAGSLLGNAIQITRSTGVVAFSQRPTFNGATPWDSGNLNLASPPSIGNATPAQVNSASGALNGSIGASTPSSGAFTTLSASGAVTGIPGRLLNVQVFSSSGTYTPTTGTAKVIVEVQAPGGGGGGVAATSTAQNAIAQSGSGGSYAKTLVTSGFSGVTVTLGAVGSAGSAGNNAGGTGGASSFGSIVSCPGGVGGAGSAGQATGFTQNGAAAPANCTVSGATVLLNFAGATGQPVTNMSSAAAYAVLGGLAALGYNSNGGNGSGGNGAAIPASTAATAGQAGVVGKVIVYEFN